MIDTAAVSFEITGMERCHRRATVAVFNVRLVFDGVEINTYGWTLEDRGECYATSSPRHRGANGRWVPSLDLPAELIQAVANEVLGLLGSPVT